MPSHLRTNLIISPHGKYPTCHLIFNCYPIALGYISKSSQRNCILMIFIKDLFGRNELALFEHIINHFHAQINIHNYRFFHDNVEMHIDRRAFGY